MGVGGAGGLDGSVERRWMLTRQELAAPSHSNEECEE